MDGVTTDADIRSRSVGLGEDMGVVTVRRELHIDIHDPISGAVLGDYILEYLAKGVTVIVEPGHDLPTKLARTPKFLPKHQDRGAPKI